MNKIRLFIFITGLTLVVFSCTTDRVKEYPSERPPNIILIYMDDMGYGDLECYGHPLIKTPHINQLAEGGIRFTSFYAPAAVCTPSRAGLLTGRYPVRNAPSNFGPESTGGLPLSETTLADVLKEAGYRTAIVGKWHLGHLPEYLPTSRGFDAFYGLPYSNDMILPWCPWLTPQDKLMLYQDTAATIEIGKNQDNLTLDYTEKALSFIRENRDHPFFLYLAHSMPHLPIAVPPQFRGRSTAGLYGDVIELVDWTVGEILKTLQEEQLEENTLIIFTSDNGPWHNLPDRMLQDGVERWHTGSTGLLRGAKATTYEGGLRVPAIMYWPGQIPPYQVNHELVSALDVFPTLIEISGAMVSDTLKVDGFNLMPLLKGTANSPRSSFIYCKGKTIQAVRNNSWKFRSTLQDGSQLFNLEEDPSEKYNRIDDFPEIAQSLKQEMQAFAEETQADIYLVGNQ